MTNVLSVFFPLGLYPVENNRDLVMVSKHEKIVDEKYGIRF